MAHHFANAIPSRLSMWQRVREYAVPESMIETATARRAVGDWAGACAAARIDVDLDLRAVRDRHGAGLVHRLRADLRRLAPDLLRWHMPRIAPDGRLRPGLTLSLARYGGAGATPLLLVVRTPPAWADAGQRMSLALWEDSGDAAPGHHPHPHPDRRFRLDLHRHLWDAARSGELARRCGAGGGPASTVPPPGLTGIADETCASAGWAVEAELLLRAEGLPRGAFTVRLGARNRVVLELVAPDDSHAPTVRPLREALPPQEVAALPVLPEAAVRVLPDLELLRAGLVTADRLHPLVASALAASGAVPARSGGTLTTSGRTLPRSGAALAAASAGLAATGDGLATAGAGLTATGDGLATAGAGLTATGDGLATAGAGLTATGDGLATADAGLAATGDGLATADAGLAATGDGLATAGEDMEATGEEMAAAGYGLAAAGVVLSGSVPVVGHAPEHGDPHRVECRGEIHRIALRDGVLTAVDHEPAQLRREELLVALGGPALPCLRAIDAVHRNPEALPAVRERLGHGDVAGALAVVEGLLGPGAILRDGPLREELESAAARRVDHGLFRSGLVAVHPAAGDAKRAGNASDDDHTDTGHRPRLDRRAPLVMRRKRSSRGRPRTGLSG
ncbi:hypothetical protein [Streptomyces canus]|uniref:hypothetical protein n=1 Tax=Streptomyces canus TaxID=58343 RepID=UPI003CEB911B